jgi:beta-fructofuranosidase
MTKSEVIATDGENLQMRIFVDQSSVEIFLEEGRHSFSFLTYPSENQCGLEFYSEGKGPRCSYRIWPLESIWKK